MIIVAGSIDVKAGCRDEFIARSINAVQAARRTSDCLDFAVSPDPVDDERVNIFEAWVSQSALDTFRESGPEDDMSALIENIQIRELSVVQNFA